MSIFLNKVWFIVLSNYTSFDAWTILIFFFSFPTCSKVLYSINKFVKESKNKLSYKKTTMNIHEIANEIKAQIKP